jgi:hypothetical protein
MNSNEPTHVKTKNDYVFELTNIFLAICNGHLQIFSRCYCGCSEILVFLANSAVISNNTHTCKSKIMELRNITTSKVGVRPACMSVTCMYTVEVGSLHTP